VSRADAESQTREHTRLLWRVDAPSLRLLGTLSLFALAYYAAYDYSMNLSPDTGAPFWLPDPLLLCTLLFSRPRNWPLYLGVTLPLRLLTAVSPDNPTWVLSVAFVNDALKALLAACLLRQLLPTRGIRFDRLHDFWVFLAAVVVTPSALSAVAGAAMWRLAGRPFWPTWRSWFLGDALAYFVLTPLILCLAFEWRTMLKARPARYLEGLAVFAGLFIAMRFASQIASAEPGGMDIFNYVPVALLLLAAVRFGPAGASAALALMSLLWLSAQARSGPEYPIHSIQLFLIVIGVPILSLSVLMAQHRATEHSLRESETRFRNMADTAPVMIWTSGPDKLATFFNRGWLHFTGRRMDQETGHGWIACVHPDQRRLCEAGYCSAFDARKLWTMECLLRRVDGEYRYILCNGAPRFTVDGVFDGYIVSGSDITDLKTAQEASLARQKLESLGVLARGIAHDFNNLLGGIHANAELAEASQNDRAFPGGEIQTIKAISMRASGIVRQLMIYAGSEGSAAELVDLSRSVREMLDLMRLSVSKSVVLKTDLAEGLPALFGNVPQIQQVVMNLVLNASEALDGGVGAITVKTALAGTVGTNGARTGQHIRLEVSDNGPGISKEAQSKIFDPFFTTKTAGRGLGLAVVQGVVRAHKGTIELSSSPGHGTTFRVHWPVADEDGASAAASPSRREEGRSVRPRCTVLVAEDEEVLRLCVAKMLRREGFAVVEADNGDAAVALLHHHPDEIDLILLDMTMPGATSPTVMAEANRLRPNARLLLTSAYSRETFAPAAGCKHVRAFIRKPFQLRDLVALIRQTLAA
jgi:PAS domain S-box-containing protein